MDANTGEIVWTVDRICHTDMLGTAATAFSGNRPITADSSGGPFRLRETGRGNGIETYNLNTGTDYLTAVDFMCRSILTLYIWPYIKACKSYQIALILVSYICIKLMC